MTFATPPGHLLLLALGWLAHGVASSPAFAGCYADASCETNCSSLYVPYPGGSYPSQCVYSPLAPPCVGTGLAFTCAVDSNPLSFANGTNIYGGACFTSPLALGPTDATGSALAPCGVCRSGTLCQPVPSSTCNLRYFAAFTNSYGINPNGTDAAYSCAPACFGSDSSCGAGCPLGSSCGIENGTVCSGGQYACVRPNNNAASLCHANPGCGGACPLGMTCEWDASSSICPSGSTGYICVDGAMLTGGPSGSQVTGRTGAGETFTCFAFSNCDNSCGIYGPGAACVSALSGDGFLSACTAGLPFRRVPLRTLRIITYLTS